MFVAIPGVGEVSVNETSGRCIWREPLSGRSMEFYITGRPITPITLAAELGFAYWEQRRRIDFEMSRPWIPYPGSEVRLHVAVQTAIYKQRGWIIQPIHDLYYRVFDKWLGEIPLDQEIIQIAYPAKYGSAFLVPLTSAAMEQIERFNYIRQYVSDFSRY
jgi:hypothetical protein